LCAPLPPAQAARTATIRVCCSCSFKGTSITRVNNLNSTKWPNPAQKHSTTQRIHTHTHTKFVSLAGS
jgi:hypothetical protein